MPIDDFSSLFPRDLCQVSRHLFLNKNELLFQRGTVATELFFVLSGELVALRTQLDGKLAIMLRARASEFFAEAALFSHHYDCDGFSYTATEVLAFPIPFFREILGREANFALNFIQSQTRRLRRQCLRQERLNLKKAHERVLHLLTCEAEADGWLRWNGSIRTLAEELALDPATLSRTLNTLERSGQIRRQGHWLAQIYT